MIKEISDIGLSPQGCPRIICLIKPYAKKIVIENVDTSNSIQSHFCRNRCSSEKYISWWGWWFIVVTLAVLFVVIYTIISIWYFLHLWAWQRIEYKIWFMHRQKISCISSVYIYKTIVLEIWTKSDFYWHIIFITILFL